METVYDALRPASKTLKRIIVIVKTPRYENAKECEPLLKNWRECYTSTRHGCKGINDEKMDCIVNELGTYSPIYVEYVHLTIFSNIVSCFPK